MDKRDIGSIVDFGDERFSRRMQSLKQELTRLFPEKMIANGPFLERIAESQGIPSCSIEELRRRVFSSDEEWKSHPLQTLLTIREIEKRTAGV